MNPFPLSAATGRGVSAFRPPAIRRTLFHQAMAAARHIFDVLREWRRRARDRAELEALDDRALRDIGVSRADVWREINKPFWRK